MDNRQIHYFTEGVIQANCEENFFGKQESKEQLRLCLRLMARQTASFLYYCLKRIW